LVETRLNQAVHFHLKTHMKTNWFMTLVGSALVLGLSGCSDPNAPADDATPGTNAAAPASPSAPITGALTATVERVGTEVTQAVEAAKPQVQEAAAAVQKAATETGAAMQAQFNAVVEDVKKLIAEGKGTEAMQKITSALGSFKLTPEQQKVIDDLKQKAQAAFSKEGVDAATKAVGNLLQPKPQN
jgi:hypothetical protein